MKNKYKLVYLMRAITQGGTDTLLETYVKYFSEKNYQIFIITALPVIKNESAYYRLEKMGAIIITPSKIEEFFLSFLIQVIAIAFFGFRKFLFAINKRFDDISFNEFKENVKKRLYLITYAIRLFLFQLKNDIDLYHSIGTRLELNLFNYFLNNKKLKLIFSEVENPKLRNSYNNSFANFLFKCNELISPSNIIKNELNLIMNSHEKNISVIPWNIPQIKKCTYLKKLDEHKLIIGALGRLHYSKGFDVLIEAMGEINNKHHNWELIIAGEGEEKDKLVSIAKKLKILDKINFIGWEKDVDKFFNRIDLFVHPSFTEGMPMVIIEALCYQKPIVATDVGSVLEMFDESCGFIVPPRNKNALIDKISFFLENTNVLEKKALASGNMFDSKFSSEVVLKQLESLYEKVINKNG